MNVAKVVIRNVAASWFGFGVNLAVVFFLTPYMIHHLGTELYGLWLALQSIVGYYGLVDVGLRAGMTQTITRHIANGDDNGVVKHISVAVPVLAGLGLLVVFIACVIGLLVPSFIEISADLKPWVVWIVVAKAAAFGMQLIFAPFGAVLIGLQRFDIENAFVVVSRILYAVFIFTVLHYGGGLLGIAIVTLLMNVFDGILRFARARHMYPALKRVGMRWDKRELSELWKFGLWNSMVHVGRQFIFFSDALVVAWLFNPAAVVPFGVAGSMIEHCNKLVTQGVRVLFPTMTHLKSAKNLSVQRDLYMTATRLIAGLSIAFLIFGSFWIKPFLVLWLGDRQQNQIIFDSAPSIFTVLGLASIFVGLHRAGSQLLIAHSQVKTIAYLYFAEGITNLGLSLSLGYSFGLIGVAYGTLLPAMLVACCGHLPAHAKALELRISQLFYQCLLRPVCFGVVIFTLMYSVQAALSEPNHWWSLATEVVITLLFGAGLAWLILLSSDQRVAFWSMVRRPLARLAAVGIRVQ